MSTFYLGVDVSKDKLAVALRACPATAAAARRRPRSLPDVANSEAGFQALQAQVAAQLEGQGEESVLHLIVEPTGNYHLRLVAFAEQQGWRVSLPNPKVVRDWAKGQGQRAKTDKVDARLLAQYGASTQPPAQQPLAAEVSELDELLHRQEDLEQMLAQERNRLHAHQQRPHPSSAVSRSLEQSLERLEEQLTEVKQAIQAHLAQYSDLAQHVRCLLKVCGIGDKTVLHILVLLYRFEARTAGQGDAKALTAFVGLDPVHTQSGSSVYKRPAISKMGDADARRRLYLCALGGNRAKDTPLTRFYRGLLARGKPVKVARIATARKILIWAWAVFRSGKPFDPQLASPAA